MKGVVSSIGTGITAGLAVILAVSALSAQDDRALVPKLPRARAFNGYHRRILDASAMRALPVTERIDLLAVRVAFSDRDFQEAPIPHDSIYFANELRHLDEYFDGASRGRFTVRWVLHPGVVRLDRPEGYFGEDGLWDERVVEMLMEVVDTIDGGVDFSSFDACAIIHAGAGQETDFNGDSPQQLWSGFVDPVEMAEILADTLGTPGVPTNDTVMGDTVYIDNLMVLPEDASQDGMTFGSLGIYAYQVGLRLGMIPLFDTTPSDFPDSQGIGSFGLMGYGLYNAAGFIPAFPCAFHRYLMGWVEPVEAAGEGEFRITDINTGGDDDTLLVRVPISAAEYFLIANRVHDGDLDGAFDFTDVGENDPIPENEDTLRGAEFDFFLTATTNPEEYVEGPGGGLVKRVVTGSGLMIWHIDESVIARSMETGRRPNDEPTRKGVDLEEADGIEDLDRPGGAFAFGSHFDSFREGNNAAFGVETDPASANNAGVITGIALKNISAAGRVMTFSLSSLRALPDVRGEIAGSIGEYSPIPIDLDGRIGEELVIPAVGGILLVAAGAGAVDWQVSADTLVRVNGAEWSAPPIFADMTGDGSPEIFVSTTVCSLYAFTASGEPYPIGSNESGTVRLPGSRCSAPMSFEADGDPTPEVILLLQREDRIWAVVAGSAVEPPVSERIFLSPTVAAFPLLAGALASHTARAEVRSGGAQGRGIFFASFDETGHVLMHYVPFMENGNPVDMISAVTVPAGTCADPGRLLLPASGDIDRDGSDEMVLSAPGFGVAFWRPGGALRVEPLPGGLPSPPVLADLDGDGVLETALRDEDHLYCFTGFGTACDNWPAAIAGTGTAGGERRTPPPVVGDIDGNGSGDLLCCAYGDLYAFAASGDRIPGWPLPGEGGGCGSPALLRGAGGELYAITASSPRSIEGSSQGGISYGTGRTSMRRYAIGERAEPLQWWPTLRHDPGGSGRQSPSSPTVAPAYFVDERSFACYPNPSTVGQVTVRVVIAGPAEVQIRVMNVEGESVLDLRRDHRWSAGSSVPFEEAIPTESMASGIYICHLEVRGAAGTWSGARTFAVIR